VEITERSPFWSLPGGGSSCCLRMASQQRCTLISTVLALPTGTLTATTDSVEKHHSQGHLDQPGLSLQVQPLLQGMTGTRWAGPVTPGYGSTHHYLLLQSSLRLQDAQQMSLTHPNLSVPPPCPLQSHPSSPSSMRLWDQQRPL
jgi:hypothetical protein